MKAKSFLVVFCSDDPGVDFVTNSSAKKSFSKLLCTSLLMESAANRELLLLVSPMVCFLSLSCEKFTLSYNISDTSSSISKLFSDCLEESFKIRIDTR